MTRSVTIVTLVAMVKADTFSSFERVLFQQVWPFDLLVLLVGDHIVDTKNKAKSCINKDAHLVVRLDFSILAGPCLGWTEDFFFGPGEFSLMIEMLSCLTHRRMIFSVRLERNVE